MKTSKQMTNEDVANLLRDISASYQIKDEETNKFKIIAYQRAADAVENLSSEIKDVWDEGKLDEIPGIGPSIAKHLDEIFRTGKSNHFEALTKHLPDAMFELMLIPGVGVKTAYKLASELGIKKRNTAFKELKEAILKNQIKRMPGFGDQSQMDISQALKEFTGRERRMLLPYAYNLAKDIINWMTKDVNTLRADSLGSLRRFASTVGDIDIAVASKSLPDSIQRFTSYPKAVRVLEKGGKTASILLPNNLQVDLIVQDSSSYGSLLQHFTGSKHHNIALREYSLKKGFSLSEYGIKALKRQNSKVKKFKTEEEFYHYIGLDWIPSELREDSGELDAAQLTINRESKLPKLIEISDIKVDLQIHSNYDIETSHDLGTSSEEEIIQEAEKLGYEYIAFTEHNPSRSKHNENEVLEILKRKKEWIEQINYSLSKLKKYRVRKVFNSLEIDILPNGLLAISPKALELLDFALVSIHSSFRLKKGEATKRVLEALNHKKTLIFAHPTGRLLGKREGIELDWMKIFEYCVKNNKWLEINTDPSRLDLPDFLVKEAIKYGVKLTLGTDAHNKEGLNNMQWGVSVARRGWAEKKDIINTLNYMEFENLLKRSKIDK